jgi:hypothetical protein
VPTKTPTKTPSPTGFDLTEARRRRWWIGRPQIKTISRASTFLEDVGFALLFPKPTLSLPSLWEVVRDDPRDDGWGPDLARLWTWKDDLPARRLAWYGRFLRGQPSLLTPELLADLYPERPPAGLSPDAIHLVDVLRTDGPQPTAVLREATGMAGKQGNARFSRTLSQLGRALLVTHCGVEDTGSGWPSAVVDLTERVFDLAPSGEPLAVRRRRAAARFADTMVIARPADLARVFGWTVDEAHNHLSAVC